MGYLSIHFGINVNTLQYNSLKSAIPKGWVKKVKNSCHTHDKYESLTLKINNIRKSVDKLKCRDYYWELVTKMREMPSCIEHWETCYYYIDFDWKYIYSLPYNITRETKLQSLQFQILNRYIPCRSFLKQCKQEISDKCKICNEIDDLEHFFHSCSSVKPFWRGFNHWFSGIFHTYIHLRPADVIFGIPNEMDDNILFVLNFCILFAKAYIYENRINTQNLALETFIKQLKCRISAEKCILESENNNVVFTAKWKQLYDALNQ